MENDSCQVMEPADLTPCSQLSIIDLCIRSINRVYVFHSYFLKIHFIIKIQYKYIIVWYGIGIAQSVYRLATGWTVGGSNPGGGEIFRTRPDRPTQGRYRVFPGLKTAGVWCWPPTPI